MRPRIRQNLLAFAVLCTGIGLLVTGCGPAPRPEVTFFVNGVAQATGPSRYCDAQVSNCTDNAAAGVVMAAPADQPVQISVPSEVGGVIWQVAFKYRKPTGEEVNGRSHIFRPSERLAYTLILPDKGDRLITAEVQRFSSVITQQPDGQLGFPISATWVLSASGQN